MAASLFRSLSALRPTDPDLSDKARRRVQLYHLLSVLGAILVPLFGGVYHLSLDVIVDPIWARGMCTLGFLGIFGSSYLSAWVRRHYVALMQTYFYGVLTWFAVLAVLNQMAGAYAVGLLFVYSVLSICVGVGVDTGWPLAGFLGYGVLLVAAGGWVVPSPDTSPSILLGCVVAMAVVLYVVVQAQLSMRRSLRRMTEEARTANRLKSALLSNMSHEVRTPLTSILGFAELIAEDDVENPRALAGRIQKSGDRLLGTLDAVLQVARLESGAVELAPEPLDVAALITERATSFEPLARERGVHLSVETEERALQAYVDPDALRKSIGVLVQNAIEFSEEGDRVRVDAWGRETTLEVTVEDTGIGMDDAMTDEVFEAFRQASRGQSRTHEGPGLGLTVAHRLITLMDGSIEIHSEKGEGTRVVVQLPRRESAPVSA